MWKYRNIFRKLFRGYLGVRCSSEFGIPSSAGQVAYGSIWWKDQTLEIWPAFLRTVSTDHKNQESLEKVTNFLTVSQNPKQ